MVTTILLILWMVLSSIALSTNYFSPVPSLSFYRNSGGGAWLLLLFKLRIALLNKEVTLGMRDVFAVALAIIGNYMQSRSSDPKLIYNCVELIN